MSAYVSSPTAAQIETAAEFHGMNLDHLHTPHSHASPAPGIAAQMGSHATMSSGHSQHQAQVQAQAHAAHQAHAAAQHAAAQAAQAHAAHSHAQHAARAGAAGAGALVEGQRPEDFMHPYMQSILGMLHNELAEKNLQLKALQEHLQDYKVLKYMSKQTERDAAKSADEVRTCKNEINKLRKELSTEQLARKNVESKYSKLITQIARAKRAAKDEAGEGGEPSSASTEPKSEKEPASTPEPNSNLSEPQTEGAKESTEVTASGETEKRSSGKSNFIDRLDETDILKSIAELGLGTDTDCAVTADDGLSPRLPTLLGEEAARAAGLEIDVARAEGKASGATGSTALEGMGSGASGLLSPSPTSGNNRASSTAVIPSSTGTTAGAAGVVDLTHMVQTGSTASMGSRTEKPAAQNEMHGVISTWGRKVCKGRIRPTSSQEFANYEFSFDLQDVDPEVEATFYIGDPVVFVALRGYNELRAVNVRLAKPRIGLPPAIFPTNNYFYYIYDIPVTNLSNIDAKLKHELKTRQVMTEYDLLDCYLKVVGQAFHDNNITYFGIVSFSEVESYKNFFRRLAECNANETDPSKKPPMKVNKTRPRGRLEFW